jgi:hypothetical protein
VRREFLHHFSFQKVAELAECSVHVCKRKERDRKNRKIDRRNRKRGEMEAV